MVRLFILVLLAGAVQASACIHCTYSSALTCAVAVAGMPMVGDPSFTAPKTAKAVVELKNATVRYDASTWKLLEGEASSEAIDANFEHVDGNVRAIALSIREFVPLDEFIESFVSGIAEEAPDTKLISRRQVVVNGVPMTEITVDMVTPDAPIRYHGFVHSGPKGVCVVLGLCHRDLFADVTTIITDVASGLTVAKTTSTPASTTTTKKKKK